MCKEKKDEIKKSHLYHYTTTEALLAILNNYREHKDSGNIVFWASSIFSMNDPQEILYGKEVLSHIIPVLEEFFQIEEEKRLKIESFDIKDILSDNTLTPFVLSLSQNEDDLSMWYMYGDKGRGVSLKFNKDIKPYHISECIIPELVKVNYTNGIDDYPLLKNIYNEGIVEMSTDQDEEEMKNCKQRTLGRLFTQLCPYIKSGAYKNENEYRFNFNHLPQEKIKFRKLNNSIVPYIEVPIPVCYLEGIVIGPSCNHDLTIRNLRFLLDCCGLQRVDIAKSEIPYRNL